MAILKKMLLLMATLVSTTVAAKPHVLMAVVDDLGWNDVQWHDDFGQIKTPKLTQLVKNESIELSNYYVYRFCSPTRSTFMTGRYPWHIGQQTAMNLNPTPGIACGINLKYDFLPKMLKPQGYTTWALGKWHLGFLTNQFTPTQRGFDHYLGYYSGAEEHFTHLKGGEDFTCYDLANNTGDQIAPCLGAVGNASGTYSSYLYGNETLRLLDLHDADTPLYIYLAWNNVHSPCEAPDNYLQVNSHIHDKSRQALAGMMSALDDQLLSVVDKFKSKGMWENTLMIFTTDNGGNLGGSGCNYPLRGGKYTFWQGGVRGNSFISGGLVPASRRGQSWGGAAHAADWYTTIAALAMADATNTGPLPPDGVALFDAIINNASSPRTEVVIQIVSNSSGNQFKALSPEFCALNNDEPLCHSPKLTNNNAPVVDTPNGPVGLETGVLIQGQYKLIMGYPGWSNQNWNGWIQPPDLESEFRPSTLGANESFCHLTPCLFDIFADPTEHNDIYAQHPDVVATMSARILELLKGEVTLEDSDLCPTSIGSKVDPRSLASAKSLGFWVPWLAPI